MKCSGILALASCMLLFTCGAARADGTIVHDPVRRHLTLTDGGGHLVLGLSYDGCCLLDQVVVRGRQVVAPATGVCSAVRIGDEWFTTRSGIPAPSVAVKGDVLTVSGIVFGGPDTKVKEDWVFTVGAGRIDWQIDRTYLTGGTLEDTYFPGWDFSSMSTWTGGLLGTGGVVWTKYLDTPLATYAVHTGDVTFWNRGTRDCLRISSSVPEGSHIASRFSRHPSGVFSASFSVTDKELGTRHGLSRFLADRQDPWVAHAVRPGKASARFTLRALDYDSVCDRGEFHGVSGSTIRELLNTIGRYGVIDRGIVGSNGWRTGYACLHEQWFAEIGLALADPDYTANYSAALDNVMRVAVKPDGRVLSRWSYGDGDAMPGTYDRATGFYECQWGYTMDSQPGYVMCVAEQFDLNGDLKWLAAQRDSCRRALDFLLRRDSDGDGLVEMMNDSRTDGKCSDWIDIVWASYENALINAELYGALGLWADLEDVLGDHERAAVYRNSGAKLRDSFNKPTSEGGFWNPDKQWYVYWRERDGSIHGDNLVTPVNFCAIAYGLCTDEVRSRAILDRIESLMQKENLFHWPLCFFGYEADEVHPSQRQFPTYENGDIFLSWAELGVRSYARTDPATALKYIRKVLDRYEQDGLSFQRYSRASQQGAGDDILAGNCLAVVGLYRDIYGVRPHFDRLYIEPHLTADLGGTSLRYRLRGQMYTIGLDVGRTRIGADGITISSRGPLGVTIGGNSVEIFPREGHPSELTVVRSAPAPLEITINDWPDGPAGARRWTEQSGGAMIVVRHMLAGLRPGARVRLAIDGSPDRTLEASRTGQVEFTVENVGGAPVHMTAEPE